MRKVTTETAQNTSESREFSDTDSEHSDVNEDIRDKTIFRRNIEQKASEKDLENNSDNLGK